MTIFPLIHFSYVLSRERIENGWTAAQGALFLILFIITTYLNFYIQMHLLFQSFIWRNIVRTVNRFGLLTIWANFWPLTLVKGWRMVELLPRVLCFLSQLTWILIFGCISPFNLLFQSFIWRELLERSTDLAYWLFEQIFRPLTSVKEWRMVEIMPGMLCFLSQLNWILYPIAELPLLQCASVLSVKMLLEQLTNQFVDR